MEKTRFSRAARRMLALAAALALTLTMGGCAGRIPEEPACHVPFVAFFFRSTALD